MCGLPVITPTTSEAPESKAAKLFSTRTRVANLGIWYSKEHEHFFAASLVRTQRTYLKTVFAFAPSSVDFERFPGGSFSFCFFDAFSARLAALAALYSLFNLFRSLRCSLVSSPSSFDFRFLLFLASPTSSRSPTRSATSTRKLTRRSMYQQMQIQTTRWKTEMGTTPPPRRRRDHHRRYRDPTRAL